MRYIQSQRNFRHYQPKKSWWSRLFSRKQRGRVVVQKAEMVGRYQNPYLRPKKRRIVLPLKSMAFSALVLGWLSIMLYAPYFKINHTAVAGLKIIKQDEIKSFVSTELVAPPHWWPRDNYFLVSADKLAEKLQGSFALNSIEVKKVFPNTIEISVEEKISSVIYDNGSGYYLLDQNGTVLKLLKREGGVVAPSSTPATASSTPITASSSPKVTHVPAFKDLTTEYGTYPIIYDSRTSTISEKQTDVLNFNVINGVIASYNAIRQAKIGSISYFRLDDPNAGVNVILDKPWQLKLQPTQDIAPQIENVKTILKSFKPQEYVDVRYGDRVYWK